MTTAKNKPADADTSGEEFVERFWIGYWQGRELVRRAFTGTRWDQDTGDNGKTWIAGRQG